MILTQTQQLSPQTFTISSDQIQGRIDPNFYCPEFRIFEKFFSDQKTNTKTLSEIAEKITSGATPKSGGSDYTTQNHGIPFIRSGNINADKIIDFDKLLYIKPEVHEKKLKDQLQEQILF